MDDRNSRKVALPETTPVLELKRTSARRTVVLSVLIAVLLALNSGALPLLPRLCVWYRLTGTDCPFCGLTRSAVATGDLNLARAVELHPLGPLVLAALVVWMIVSAVRWKAGRPPALPRWIQKLLFIVSAIAWIAWWVIARIIT